MRRGNQIAAIVLILENFDMTTKKNYPWNAENRSSFQLRFGDPIILTLVILYYAVYPPYY